jgi:hypothetical protein
MALDLLEDKVLRLGGSHRQVWFLTVSYEMLRTTQNPEQIDYHLRTIVDRLTVLLYKDLGRQEQLQQLKIEPSTDMLTAMSESANKVITLDPKLAIQWELRPVGKFHNRGLHVHGIFTGPGEWYPRLVAQKPFDLSEQ